MNELIISLVSGIIGGLVVLLFQKFWDKYEKRKDLLISPTVNKKILPKDILLYLEPGLSIEKAREFLGIPDNVYTYHEPEENEDSIRPQIYFYNFKNAALKISSNDRISIDSITMFSKEGENNKIEIFPNQYEELGRGILGETVIDDDIIENNVKHFDLSTMRERLFAIETYYGRLGGYLTYTYFGEHYKNYELYSETNDIDLLKGEKIIGFCVTCSDFSPSISIYEMK